MKKTFSILTVLVIVIVACHRKTVPTVAVQPVTYTSNIKPIIQNHCTPCHVPSQGGKVANLDGYENAKKHISNMIARVELPQSDPKFMPFKLKKPALSAAQIDTLKMWRDGGMME